MKRLMVFAIVCGVALSAAAQFSPVQLKVDRLTKKKDEGERATSSGSYILIYAGDYSASMGLRITLRNGTSQPLNGLTVRWGVVKSQASGFSRTGDAAYGAEETLDLKPLEQKVIETPTVTAKGKQFNDGDARGEKIRGHGVQVLQSGKVLVEEFMPPATKKAFENLRPVGSGKENE